MLFEIFLFIMLFCMVEKFTNHTKNSIVITLAISSQKGGVGKTTLAINLAHAFARSGRRTLLVDSDPQGSVGFSLSRNSRSMAGFYDFLGDEKLGVQELVVSTQMPTLSLMTVGQDSDYELDGGAMGVTQLRLRTFLAEVKALGYDLCLIDTAAGFFGATAGVLNCADAVVVPQQAEPLGVRSAPKVLEALNRMRMMNPQLDVLGLVLTMVNEGVVESRDAAMALRDLLPAEMVLKTEISRDDLYLKASARGVPVGVMEEGEEFLAIFEALRFELEKCLEGRLAPRE